MVLVDGDECPIVGKINSINGEHATISTYRAGVSGIYKPFIRPNGQARTMVVMKDCITMVFDSLTPTQRLPGNAARQLERMSEQSEA